MPAPFAHKKRHWQGASWMADLEEFHARVDSVCRSLDRFTPAEFQRHFGFVEPMNYGYKSLEDLFVMRGCEHEGGGVFIYKEITSPLQTHGVTGNEAFDPPKIPPNIPLGRLNNYHHRVDSVVSHLKPFSISEFEGKFAPKAHEEFGYCSVEHLLLFRGCQRTGEGFVYDSVKALQTKALAVASYLDREFSEFEFKSVYRRFFLTNQLSTHLLKRGFNSLFFLLSSIGGVEINGFGHDQGYVKYVLRKSDRRESQGPMDVQARANTIPVPSDDSEKPREIQKQKAPVLSEVVEVDSSDSEIEILHENIVTKKRSPTANEDEAASDFDGKPAVKKKKKHAEEASPKPTDTIVDKDSNGDSIDVLCPDKEMRLKTKQTQANITSNTSPALLHNSGEIRSGNVPAAEQVEKEANSEGKNGQEVTANPNSEGRQEHEKSSRDKSNSALEKQVSAITAEMDQSIQKERAMGGKGDHEAVCRHSQPSEASSADSYDEALIERMNRYHNEFLNAVITGAMKKGVDPEDLGKKVLDRIFEKNSEP